MLDGVGGLSFNIRQGGDCSYIFQQKHEYWIGITNVDELGEWCSIKLAKIRDEILSVRARNKKEEEDKKVVLERVMRSEEIFCLGIIFLKVQRLELIGRLRTDNFNYKNNSANTMNSREIAIMKAKASKLSWEPIFFEAINERIQLAILNNLRSSTLSVNDIEVRVWIGFGLTPLEGIVIRRAASVWSAIHLEGLKSKFHFENFQSNIHLEHLHYKLHKSQYQKQQKELKAPNSGWEGFWRRVVDEGILTLPDGDDTECNLTLDGTGYVVEINVNKAYRTYMYNNPAYAKCDDAKHMIKIIQIIREEFGI